MQMSLSKEKVAVKTNVKLKYSFLVLTYFNHQLNASNNGSSEFKVFLRKDWNPR